MKYLIALCATLISFTTFAQPFSDVTLAQPEEVAAAGGGATYLFTESFEGVGYENSWTEDLGVPNEDDTSPVHHGSQSLNLTVSSRLTQNTTFTALSPAYVFFAIYFTSDATDYVFQGRNGTTDVWSLQRNSDDTFRVIHGTGASFGTTVATFAVGAWIYVWIEYTAGSGANGTLNAYFSTTTTKPGSPDVAISNGTATLGMTQFYIRQDSVQDYNIDRVLVDDVAIGNAP